MHGGGEGRGGRVGRRARFGLPYSRSIWDSYFRRGRDTDRTFVYDPVGHFFHHQLANYEEKMKHRCDPMAPHYTPRNLTRLCHAPPAPDACFGRTGPGKLPRFICKFTTTQARVTPQLVGGRGAREGVEALLGFDVAANGPGSRIGGWAG